MNDDYRLFLNEKFERVFSELNEIKQQTAITNKRVNNLESDLINIKLTDKDRYKNCENTKEIKEIKDDLLEYKVLKKYPKTFLYTMFIYGISIIILFLFKFNIF